MSYNRFERSVGRLQNALSGTIFAGLAIAELSSWLLHVNPTSSLLWQISMPLYKWSFVLLDPVHNYFAPGAMSMIAVFCVAMSMPAIAQWRKSWLGSAACGHICLGLWTYLTLAQYQQPRSATASATGLIEFTFEALPTNILSMAVLLVMTWLCVCNHLAFYRSQRRSSRQALAMR